MSTYTHGHHASVLTSHRWRTAANSAAYLLPHLDASVRLLDLGAGPGTVTADLAGLVSHVTATEINEDVLQLTRAEIRERGLKNVDLVVADAHDLPFDDDMFDVAHAHQVLQHVADPVRALRELRRVTRPGGIVAVRDSDYAGFAWFPAVPELDEWLALYRKLAHANGGEPDAGRMLRLWALRAGFTDVTASSSTWCFSNDAERAWWGGMWAERMVDSAIARQAVDSGAANPADLQRLSAAWRTWADRADAWFSVLHGELICRA